MKRKFVAFALIIAAFVSVTSGCYVGYGYDGQGRYHHHRDHDYRGDHGDHHDRDNHDRY